MDFESNHLFISDNTSYVTYPKKEVIWAMFTKDDIDYDDLLTEKQWEQFVEKVENEMSEQFEEMINSRLWEDEFCNNEFKCDKCDTVQGFNECSICDNKNVCEECYGQGGDYGPHEIWVCNKCLPTCNGCAKKLYSAMDECCNKGRSDRK